MNLYKDLAEKEVIKSLLFDSRQCEWALSNLKPNHFFNIKTKNIFERIVKLLKDGKEISIVTILENDDRNEDLILSLSTEAMTAANSRSQAEAVLNTYYKREAQTRLIELSQHVTEINATPDTLREKAESLAYFLSFRTDSKTLQPMSAVVKDTLKELNTIAEKGKPGIPTGFRDVDRIGWSLRPKTMTILAARPSMGKSALALDFAEQCGVPAAFFSLEMEGIEQCERMISKRMGLSNDELRNPTTINQSREAIAKVGEELSRLPIYVNDSPSISPMQLRMQCKRAIAKWGIRVAFIDYMGYIEDEEQKSENRRLEMGKYSRAIKQMAKELNLAMVPICQLNRKCEERNDKRPILSDLREVGDLEQDAHLVMFLYRESIYNDECDDTVAELITRKCRGGQTGTIKLKWNGRLTTFSDYSDPSDFNKNDWTDY